MNRRAMLCGVLALTTIGVVAGAGCGTMRSGSMSKEDAIAKRQELMKRQGAAFGAINRKLKAGEIPAVATDAEVLIETSKQIAPLFPAGSTSPTTSRAKPEIWQQWAQFEGYTKTLNAEATKLRDAARANNANGAQAAFGAVAKNACTACHDAFRGPEIKK